MPDDDKLLGAELVDDRDDVVGERTEVVVFGVSARLPPTSKIDRYAAMIF